MGVHKICSTTDRALVAYLISLGIGDDQTIYPAKRALDKENPPYVVCMSSGRPTVQYSGNWTMEVEIAVHTNACPDKSENEETMQEESEDLASDVFDAFLSYGESEQAGDKLADEITQAARGVGLAFTVLDVSVSDVNQTRTDKYGEWVDILTIELTCIPKNV